MSALAEAIERARTRPVSRQSSRSLGVPSMRAVADRVGSTAPFSATPVETLERLRAQFDAALRANTLASLPRIAWDRLPGVLWYGNEPQLAEDGRILAMLKEHIAEHPNARCIRGLMAIYVREFHPGDSSFEAIAAIAKWAATAQPTRAGSAWVEASERFALFDAAQAPGRIANAILSADGDSLGIESIPIPGWTPAGRLGTAAFLALLASIRTCMTDSAIQPKYRGAMLEGAAAWLNTNKGGANPSLVVQVALADSLLSPWGNKNIPGQALRKFIVDLILKHVGDPRTAAAAWLTPELAGARQVLTAWLSLRTIEEFCDIIDETAEQGHWQDRRRFWAWYAERRFVSDAWVAYGPRAARRAHAMGITPSAFGKLTEARDQGHSVLLMKIGSLTIAEFSHSGSCRFYPSGTWQPTFYEKEYSDSTLRARANDATAHHQGWQTRIADFIRDQTGVRSDFEYRYR